MVIQGIASSYTSPAQTKSSSGSTVSKDDFLKLLVTQLQKQDPLNPSDPTQFTSQLAQFSSLEQLTNVNTNLTGLSTQDLLNSRMSAAGFIGKKIQVNSSTLSVNSGKTNAVQYSLPSDSTATSVNIYDSSGTLINVVSLGTQSAGSHDFTWNATGSNGSKMADGNYKFEITGQDSAGHALTTTCTTTGQVTGVSFDPTGQTILNVGNTRYGLSEVQSISA